MGAVENIEAEGEIGGETLVQEPEAGLALPSPCVKARGMKRCQKLP